MKEEVSGFITPEREFIAMQYNEREYIFCDPQVCKHFGCGKMLTLQEKRFGNYCIDHLTNKNKSYGNNL